MFTYVSNHENYVIKGVEYLRFFRHLRHNETFFV